MTTTETETALLPGDRDALTTKRWKGPRGWETNGFDHLIGADVEHCRNAKEAKEALLAQRKVVIDEHREHSPLWVETAESRLAAHRKAYDAKRRGRK